MNADLRYHFPPDLLELLVETVPLLTKGKQALLVFFRGAGVPDTITADLKARVDADRNSISKYEITRTILQRLNEKGDEPNAIRYRRDIVRRVVEWEDYTSCYADKVPAAKGYVADVRRLVNVVDSFRRMEQEKDAERKKNQDAKDAELAVIQKRNEDLAKVKSDFYGLFGVQDAQKRGKALEKVLNDWFKVEGVGIRHAFCVRCDESGKVLEQVDGTVEVDHIAYLTEMKWWEEPVGVPEVSQHISRLYLRHNEVRGIIIAYRGFTDTAVKTCKDALVAGSVMILLTLQDLVSLLESGGKLADFLQERIRRAVVDKHPL